jgi:putative FmdB family regulatory protein
LSGCRRAAALVERAKVAGGRMPLYEFHCRSCGKDFSVALSLAQYEAKAYACPGCKSRDAERVVENVEVVTSKKS